MPQDSSSTPAAAIPPLSEAALAAVVAAFYARVREDAELGPIFNGAITDWDHHLGKLAAFWSSVMLGTGRYKGRPMAAHFSHADAMTPGAFRRWLALWKEATEALLPAAQAAALLAKAAHIAQSIAMGIDFQRGSGLPGAGPLPDA